MSRAVARCILIIFKFICVFYHLACSLLACICSFQATILQRYLYRTNSEESLAIDYRKSGCEKLYILNDVYFVFNGKEKLCIRKSQCQTIDTKRVSLQSDLPPLSLKEPEEHSVQSSKEMLSQLVLKHFKFAVSTLKGTVKHTTSFSEPKRQSIQSSDEPKKQSVQSYDEPKEQTVQSSDEPKEQTVQSSDGPKEQTVQSSDEHKKQTVWSSDEPKKQTVQPSDEPKQQPIQSSDASKKQSILYSDEPKTQSVLYFDEPKTQSVLSSDEPKNVCIIF